MNSNNVKQEKQQQYLAMNNPYTSAGATVFTNDVLRLLCYLATLLCYTQTNPANILLIYADESTVAAYGDYDNADGGAGSWEQYYDDNGYAYWYNNATGASQYESPYE